MFQQRKTYDLQRIKLINFNTINNLTIDRKTQWHAKICNKWRSCSTLLSFALCFLALSERTLWLLSAKLRASSPDRASNSLPSPSVPWCTRRPLWLFYQYTGNFRTIKQAILSTQSRCIAWKSRHTHWHVEYTLLWQRRFICFWQHIRWWHLNKTEYSK